MGRQDKVFVVLQAFQYTICKALVCSDQAEAGEFQSKLPHFCGRKISATFENKL